MKARLAPHAFPKDFRLLRRAQFKRVYDEGQRRSTSICTIFFKSNGLSQTRLGITATARLGKAVLRNRVKRRLREVFRLHRGSIPGGWDIVLNPRVGVAKAAFSAVEREVLRLFPQAPPPASATSSPSR
ncbi:MAG: ribonuclease P protein component [Terriglobia bacterium]|jgi:ribonuclease P protein component